MTNDKLLKLTLISSTIASIILITIKISGWFMTNSVGILSSFVDSLLDILISLINTIALFYSLKPADYNHKFGHTAIEDIVGLAQATFISGSAMFIIFQSINKLIYKETINNHSTAIYILLLALLINISLVALQFFTLKKTNSQLIKAEILHYTSDIGITFLIILSIILDSKYSIILLDGVIGIIIALYILYHAIGLIKQSFKHLLDHEISDDDKKIIISLIENHEGALGFHDLRTRQSGSHKFVQFHLDIREEILFKEAHAIADSLEQKIIASFDRIEVIIHQDPVPIPVESVV